MRHRGSIFTGLLLIVLGVLFLIDRFDHDFQLGHLIRIYWPVLIILWGVAKLIDHLALRRGGESRPPFLSGGEAALLILLAFVLTGFVFRDWLREHYPDFDIEFPPFHQSYTQDQQLEPQTIPDGAHVVIEIPHGDISIQASSDNFLRVSAKESAWAPTKSEADEQLRALHLAFEQEGNTYHLRPLAGNYASRIGIDLDVKVPKSASLEADTRHGDIEIAGVSGKIVARSGAGDIDVTNAGADVEADLGKGDVKIAGVAGSVRLSGRGGDIDLSNVSGDVSIQGAFVGTVHASNVAKTVRCMSPWADLTVEQLSGHLEADSGDIELEGASGPAKLITHNKDIRVENVAGRIEIVNTHGDVRVSYAKPPLEDLSIRNDSGDAEITLPAASTFQVSATSRSGEVQNQFGSSFLSTSNENDRGQISGRVGTTGPSITVATSYGTIHLNKS